MNTKTFGQSLLATVLLATTLTHTATAHHAFAAEFDGDRPVKLEGVVTNLKWTNPHSWLYLDVKNADGTVTNWAVEFGGPYNLLQKGLRKTDFPAGTPVVVDGFLARNGKAVANASSVKLSDGRDFYTAAEDSPGVAARGPVRGE